MREWARCGEGSKVGACLLWALCAVLGCAGAGPWEPAPTRDAGSGRMSAPEDGGTERDAGEPATQEGGVRDDAGFPSDAGGPTRDGGAAADGGAQARDGGASVDAGAGRDGGAVRDAGAADAGSTRDAGVPPDRVDAGLTGDADAAVLVHVDLPATMGCGRLAQGLVRMQNVGTMSWANRVPDTSHRLGRLEPLADLFPHENLRFNMGAEATVPPGQAYSFRFTIQAPRAPGRYPLRLQMVHEQVRWFGPIVDRDVVVTTEGCVPEPADACARSSSQFLGDVEAAITYVQDTWPHLFYTNVDRGGRAWAVRDELGYTYGVTDRLNAMGLVAVVDAWAGDEISVKSNEASSENFDILAYDPLYPGGNVRRGAGAYRVTCTPAQF